VKPAAVHAGTPEPPRHKNFAKEKEFLVKGINFARLKLRHFAPVVKSIIKEITNYEIEG